MKKITTFGHMKAAMEIIQGMVSQVVYAAAQDIKALDSKKQDRINGAAGQVVGFSADGKPIAQGTESLRGPKGDTGTRGATMHWGTAITGTSTTAAVFSGSGIASALVDDLYLNTGTWNIYQCTVAGAASAAKWVYKGNIKGATGATGAPGTDGAAGTKGATGATGTRGSQIYWGTAVTGTSTTATAFSSSGITSALVNDLYLNTSTWNIYQCTTAGAAAAAKWVYKGNIKGATGAAGSDGANGEKGATGATGTRGSRWTTGTAITGTSTTATVFSGSGITDALVNDMYFNSSTCNVYKCTVAGAAAAAKWVYVCCMKGATGAAGANATTTAVATASANGLMSKDMVTKLNGVATGATKNVINFATTAPSKLADGEIVMVYEE